MSSSNSETGTSKCEWDFPHVSCCKNIWKLFVASNDKIYCVTHLRIMEYALYTSGHTSYMIHPNTAESVLVRSNTIHSNESSKTTHRNESKKEPVVTLDKKAEVPEKVPVAVKPIPAPIPFPILVPEKRGRRAKKEHKWTPVAKTNIAKDDPNFPPIGSVSSSSDPKIPPEVGKVSTASTSGGGPTSVKWVPLKIETSDTTPTPATNGITPERSGNILIKDIPSETKILELPGKISKDIKQDVPKDIRLPLGLSASQPEIHSGPKILVQIQERPNPSLTGGKAPAGKSNLTRSADSIHNTTLDTSKDRFLGDGNSPGPSRKECNAKACSDVNIKHVYQGYFCPVHEEIIRKYRIVIDANRKDMTELLAREEEQMLRKVPHPLYQKNIDNLKITLRRAEADFINTMFSS